MHLPGYIQEGREASYGYLLLGVYHRNSPSCTVQLNCCTARGRGSSERTKEQDDDSHREGGGAALSIWDAAHSVPRGARWVKLGAH